MFKRISFILIVSVFMAGTSLKASVQVTRTDYQRADSIMKLNDLVYYQVNKVNWIDSTSTFWYQVKTRDGGIVQLVDAAKMTKKTAFDVVKLVEQLNKQEGIKTTPKSVQLQNLKFELKANKFHFEFSKAYWTCSLKNYALTKDSLVKPEKPKPYWNDNFDELGNKPVHSPDGKWIAFIKNYNVYLSDTKEKKATQLSFDGSAGDYYSSYFSWSSDSKRLAVNKVRKNEDRVIYFVESSPKTQLQPILQKRNYLKPGDALPIKRPSLFNIETLKQVPVDSKAFENQYHLSTPKRDGWNHLYLYDTQTGKVKNQITHGNWVVREVVKVDEKKNTIIFKASGINPGEDPYFIHYCKVNFDGSDFVELTPEHVEHQAFFSEDYNYFVDTYSSVNRSPVTVLRQTSDGSVIMELERADIVDVLAKGWIAPEPFVAKGRDGKTDIWGNIYRPSNFDSTKKYPVIEYIYAGPHSSFAQKAFKPSNFAFSGLAELGFIVVQLDGMGTSNRSKAFHDVCYKNLKDAGFPDRILWIKAAAEKYSYMDTTRVGLFGGSAGGQNTLSGLLFHPEFYKAGSSSCGCHDNRMDKMWWNEQWLGYPIGPQYAECSNVVNAAKLKGKLLLIVGEMDDNVDPASTMQVVNALITAKKDFELVVLPGVNHTLGGEYGEQKRRDFFVKTFYNQATPDWNKVVK